MNNQHTPPAGVATGGDAKPTYIVRQYMLGPHEGFWDVVERTPGGILDVRERTVRSPLQRFDLRVPGSCAHAEKLANAMAGGLMLAAEGRTPFLPLIADN